MIVRDTTPVSGYFWTSFIYKVIQTNFKWPLFVYTKISYIRFPLWPFDTSQQVKSVIPKYSRKQNRDQTSDHVVIFR